MGESTAIAWTDHTFNPWWGCTRVSPGCEHCYAETFAKRTGNDVWGKNADRRFFGDKHWNEPVGWDTKARDAGVRRRVFCASMADVFEDRDDLVEPRQRLFDLIAITPNLDWQLLTKRPENVKRLLPLDEGMPVWPLNAWIGTTAEDQQRANERIPWLIDIPAPVRFLSCEPLLGSIFLGTAGAMELYRPGYAEGQAVDLVADPDFPQLQARSFVDWVIVGGESGPKHRPMNLDHARSLRDQCADAGTPFFFKQVGGRTPTAGGDQLDGQTYKAFPTSAVLA